MFPLFAKACLLYKTFKIVFLRIIFTIYDMGIQGVTRGYRRLQGVKTGDKRLQKGYMSSQEVTGVCKGLQEIKRGYKG